MAYKLRIYTRSVIMLTGGALIFLSAAVFQNYVLRSRRTQNNEQLINVPPLLKITSVVLGGFRGLLADVLWLRASRLQDEGRYFELVPLTDWITKLEPEIPEIWSFHAWNMAFNVSAMMENPADRWRWIQNGISLLRDQGLHYNPNTPKLFSELSWIYVFKIGGETDISHMYYKQKLAQSVHSILNGGRLSGNNMTDEVKTQFKDLLGLNINLMAELDRRYGPLDWRLPESFAIYWSVQGLNHATQESHVLCERILHSGLETSFIKGNLDFDPNSGHYDRINNFDVLPNILVSYDTALNNHPTEYIKSAYVMFLKRAINVLQGAGKHAQSQQLSQRLESILVSE